MDCSHLKEGKLIEGTLSQLHIIIFKKKIEGMIKEKVNKRQNEKNKAVKNQFYFSQQNLKENKTT